MSYPLEPRPVGDPAAMQAFADELSTRAKALAAEADALYSRSKAATFEGPAGTRFGEHMLAQRQTLHAVGGDLNELANRIRSEAQQVQANIDAWERYRDAAIQQRAEAARTD